MTERTPIAVIPDAEAEQARFVVCCRVGTRSYFTDNQYGTCAHCGHGIFFRPYMPKGPTKICMECMMDMARGGTA